MSGRTLGVVILGASLGAGCSTNPTSTEIVEPIQVDRVEVLILESFPPQATAHVEGILGDGCAALHSQDVVRSGNTVTVTILRRRPADAVCIQIALLYREDIRLPGQDPPGTYLLRVNGVERTFTTE